MFSSNFWTHDYISGVNTLLTQLNVNAVETRRVLEFIRSRVNAERDFSSILSFAEVEKQSAKADADMLKAQFRACVNDTRVQAGLHLVISDDLDRLCFEPLAKVDQSYTKNLKNAEKSIKQQFSAYSKLRAQAAKHKTTSSPQPPAAESGAIDSAMSTLRLFKEKYTATPSLVGLQKNEKIVLAGITYRGTDALELLRNIVKGAKISEYKAMLIGTYENVSTGAAIASSSRRFLKNDSIAYSEKFGQGLVDAGLLKPVAQLSNKFQNSHTSYYQWQAGLLELIVQGKQQLEDAGARTNLELTLSPPQEIERPVSPGLAADTEAYLQSILELDMYRCALELEIFNMYSFLEECELDRIMAVKSAIETYQKLCLPTSRINENHEEVLSESNWDPKVQLELFTRKYRSGPFVPSVAVYHGRNGTICQTFGVELEKTSFFTDIVLSQLENQRIPLSTWTKPYNLEDVYKLRSQVNTGRKFNESIFRFFSTETICGTLLQYYLELPESVIPFSVYDLARHSSPISILRTLGTVQLNTLKRFLGVLRRYNSPTELGTVLAHYLFRPRAASALTMDDKHPAKLLTLLLRDYEEVFKDITLVAEIGLGLSTPPVMSPALSEGGFRALSPRPGSQDLLSAEGNRPRTGSSGSALETTNGTHLIPLSLSPDLNNRSSSPRLEMRSGIKLSGFLPIGGNQNVLASPTLSRRGTPSPTKLRIQTQAEDAVPEGATVFVSQPDFKSPGGGQSTEEIQATSYSTPKAASPTTP